MIRNLYLTTALSCAAISGLTQSPLAAELDITNASNTRTFQPAQPVFADSNIQDVIGVASIANIFTFPLYDLGHAIHNAGQSHALNELVKMNKIDKEEYAPQIEKLKSWSKKADNAWPLYCNIELGILVAGCLNAPDACEETFYSHMNRYQDAYNRSDIGDLSRHTIEVLSEYRDELFSVAYNINRAIPNERAIPKKLSSDLVDRIYPITDNLNLANFLYTLWVTPEKVTDKLKMMAVVPHTIGEVLTPFKGRVSLISPTRAISRFLQTRIGGKFFEDLHGSTFSGALPMPLATGFSRCLYAQTFSDDVATVLAQATVTTGAWYIGYAPIMLAIDVGLNVAVNPEGYRNGLAQIASSIPHEVARLTLKMDTYFENYPSTTLWQAYTYAYNATSAAYNSVSEWLGSPDIRTEI